MFKWLFYYLNNNLNSTSNLYKINIWFFINIRILKIKLTNYIVFYINSINNLKIKTLKIFYKDLNFEYFYFNFLKLFIFLFIFLFVIL